MSLYAHEGSLLNARQKLLANTTVARFSFFNGQYVQKAGSPAWTSSFSGANEFWKRKHLSTRFLSLLLGVAVKNGSHLSLENGADVFLSRPPFFSPAKFYPPKFFPVKSSISVENFKASLSKFVRSAVANAGFSFLFSALVHWGQFF
jgi:hypothetical protein